jgi:hypothetical protein
LDQSTASSAEPKEDEAPASSSASGEIDTGDAGDAGEAAKDESSSQPSSEMEDGEVSLHESDFQTDFEAHIRQEKQKAATEAKQQKAKRSARESVARGRCSWKVDSAEDADSLSGVVSVILCSPSKKRAVSECYTSSGGSEASDEDHMNDDDDDVKEKTPISPQLDDDESSQQSSESPLKKAKLDQSPAPSASPSTQMNDLQISSSAVKDQQPAVKKSAGWSSRVWSLITGSQPAEQREDKQELSSSAANEAAAGHHSEPMEVEEAAEVADDADASTDSSPEVVAPRGGASVTLRELDAMLDVLEEQLVQEVWEKIAQFRECLRK